MNSKLLAISNTNYNTIQVRGTYLYVYFWSQDTITRKIIGTYIINIILHYIIQTKSTYLVPKKYLNTFTQILLLKYFIRVHI